MTQEEYEELCALREYKRSKEADRLDKAFIELEKLVANTKFDPLISPRAFKIISECILALREEVRR
jgi:hypothetical protein